MHEGRETNVSDVQRASSNVPPPAAKAALPVVIGTIVVFGILVVVIWRIGVFDNDTSASDAKVVAGLLTLLGGLIASAFTLVGLLLKHSIDRYTASLAAEAELSRRLEAQETERRLRLETSIKAVELLTTPDGKPAPPERQAGALIVLGSKPLEQLELAVALLRENWASGHISPSAGVWVIDRALKQDTRRGRGASAFAGWPRTTAIAREASASYPAGRTTAGRPERACVPARRRRSLPSGMRCARVHRRELAWDERSTASRVRFAPARALQACVGTPSVRLTRLPASARVAGKHRSGGFRCRAVCCGLPWRSRSWG